MATLRDIKNRIVGVKNTQKITDQNIANIDKISSDKEKEILQI